MSDKLDKYTIKLLNTIHSVVICEISELKNYSQVSEDIQMIVDDIVKLRLEKNKQDIKMQNVEKAVLKVEREYKTFERNLVRRLAR